MGKRMGFKVLEPFAAMLTVVFTILGLAVQTPETVDAIAKKVYHSATEYDYPPFSVIVDGKEDGFSVELWKA